MTDEEDVYVGKRALREGLVTNEQLFDCLLERADQGRTRQASRALGPLLVDRGLLSRAALDRFLADRNPQASPPPVSTACASCGARFKILRAKPGVAYSCKRCGGRLEPVEESPPPESIPEAISVDERSGPDPGEIDRAAFLYLRQKNMLRRDALRDLALIFEEAGRYGVRVPLLDHLERRKLLAWRAMEEVRKFPFARIVAGAEWKGQAIPGYGITRKIATGGFAAIFAAKPLFGGPEVALKLLHRQRAADELSLKRFRFEGILMMRLDHPHVIKAYELGEHRGVHYFTMELVDGPTLHHAVKERGGLDPKTALALAGQIADALHHLQKEGYIHRDLKPENVLLDREGRAKLGDFGFASEIRARSQEKSDITLGTAGFVSPEQARGEQDLKVGTDIYSLGLTLYFMLTAHVPFDGADAEKVMAERFAGGVAAPDFGRIRAPADVVELTKRMLDPDRTRRFTTYPELLAALKKARAT